MYGFIYTLLKMAEGAVEGPDYWLVLILYTKLPWKSAGTERRNRYLVIGLSNGWKEKSFRDITN